MGYDTWKSTNRDDEELGRARVEKYRCRDCAWKGPGITPASEHFWQTGHTVLLASDPRFKARDAATKRATA